MIFNSIEFILFLPIVFLLYWLVFNKKLSHQNGLLLIASYFFYGWWSWMFLGLLFISTAMDYAYGYGVASTNRKKARLFLWLSALNNFGVLGVFKYFNFFATELQHGFLLLGIKTNPILLQVALPIGISFYTFHGMSYVFDIYNGKQRPIKNFIDYALFVSFFPLLVAGPIERAHHLLPQLPKRRFFNYQQAVEGCRLILWGLFKKVVIADALAVTVDSIFSNYLDLNGFTLIIGAIAFSFQIYGDFSGYSDIAIGTAKLLGFELLSNFKFPYFSRDIAEFWRRWHISLSSWFRDYLYIPMGGSKKGKLISIRNTFVVFLISGFWHGANWNFIAWGFIHACGFLTLLLLNKNRKHVNTVVAQFAKTPSLIELFQIISTFAFVSFAWIFFRAKSLTMALDYIRHIGISIWQEPGQFFTLPGGKLTIIYILPLILIDWYLRFDERKLRLPKTEFLRIAIYIILSLFIAFQILTYFYSKPSSFIYFQF